MVNSVNVTEAASKQGIQSNFYRTLVFPLIKGYTRFFPSHYVHVAHSVPLSALVHYSIAP